MSFLQTFLRLLLPQDFAMFIKPTALLFSAIITKVNNSKQTASLDNNKPLPSVGCIISLTAVRICTLRHGCISNGLRLIRGQNSDLYSVSFNDFRQLKQSLYRPGKALSASGGWDSKTIYRQSAHEGSKVVSPMHRPPLSPGETRGTHFC